MHRRSRRRRQLKDGNPRDRVARDKPSSASASSPTRPSSPKGSAVARQGVRVTRCLDARRDRRSHGAKCAARRCTARFQSGGCGRNRLAVIGVAARAERVEVLGARPPLEDIDPGGIHRIGRDREVETPRCLAGETHSTSTCNDMGVSVRRIEDEVTGDDEHPPIVPTTATASAGGSRGDWRHPRRLVSQRPIRTGAVNGGVTTGTRSDRNEPSAVLPRPQDLRSSCRHRTRPLGRLPLDDECDRAHRPDRAVRLAGGPSGERPAAARSGPDAFPESQHNIAKRPRPG